MFLVILFGFFLVISDASFFRPHEAHVQISNDIGHGIELIVHCKSGDDDLGEQKLQYQGTWGFRFRPNIWGTTLFFCSFKWQDQFLYFNVFDWNRDFKDYFEFLYSIVPTNPCKYNVGTNKYDICYEWNK
ncbi:hypothetical protein SLEP1_g57060 [Rubroshorea leprosula]|uniref:S-protein homolog n=1 Tax=Rubroshorea leprosula TaxID=152421 RepID=A0AAV5MPK8_9ROSI|nr:hypothetical protein SLEP1_g57060 [Rubroshorea leprosula]